MTHYQIRDAATKDHSAINALAVEAWRVLKDGYDHAQWDNLLATIGKMSNLAEKGQLIVASGESQIFGAVAYMPPKASNPDVFPEGWPSIRMLVVPPACRNLGIGRRLIGECVRRARRDHAHCIGLHTSPIMTVALPLYLRMGFVKDRELAPIAGAPYASHVLTF
jgi:ribosomal protein S18 acetylase RimI-like enzyme